MQAVNSPNPSRPSQVGVSLSYKSVVQSGKRSIVNPVALPAGNLVSDTNSKSGKKRVKPPTGLKFETTKTVYVSNIRMDFADDDDVNVIDRVKSHTASVKLDITNVVVVHNRRWIYPRLVRSDHPVVTVNNLEFLNQVTPSSSIQ
ncbi:unnamed protein product [Owenia fusiformis]|uniref:Uncharacterized protein n=1 Tax=Owenia fusiformis TaxID=6347 RepID=A0A8J1Y0G1_OWEFU|nr:unnamed protein product [Owenia fusiformis]